MARVRMVTRTVEVSVVEVLCMDTEAMQPRVMTYKLGGTYEKERDILKALKKEYEEEGWALVKIRKIETESTLYGMPESLFIQLAEILPNR